MSEAKPKILESELIAKEPSGNMMLNMGPSHPAMHGIVGSFFELEGEVVRDAEDGNRIPPSRI